MAHQVSLKTSVPKQEKIPMNSRYDNRREPGVQNTEKFCNGGASVTENTAAGSKNKLMNAGHLGDEHGT